MWGVNITPRISIAFKASVALGINVINNVLHNRTAMPTRPHYFQLSIFLYPSCVFLDHSGFALLPRYLTNAGLMYRHMGTRTLCIAYYFLQHVTAYVCIIRALHSLTINISYVRAMMCPVSKKVWSLAFGAFIMVGYL